MKSITTMISLALLMLCSLSLSAQVPLELVGPNSSTIDILDLTSQSSTTRVNFNTDSYLLYGSNKRAYIETSDYYLRFATSSNNIVGGILFATHDNGTPGDRMFITNTGNVGIGTLSPSERLDVSGRVKINNYKLPMWDGTAGQVLTSNGSGDTYWAAPSGGSSSEVSFNAVLASSIDPLPVGFTPIQYVTNFYETFDNGSGFDHVNGIFTAPVAGTYYFTFRPSATSNATGGFDDGRFITRILVNNSIKSERHTKGDIDSGWFLQHMQHLMVELNAGDQVRLTAMLQPPNWSSTGKTAKLAGGYVQSNTIFSGYLVK